MGDYHSFAMGTYTSTSGHGTDAASAYRKLEIAYHELQSIQVHLRSVHACSMHGRTRDPVLTRQELLRLNDQVERATSAYRNAMADYVRATSSPSRDGQDDAAPVRPSSSSPRFPTGVRP